MKIQLGKDGVSLFTRWVEEEIEMEEAIEIARKKLPPDEYATFLLQMGGYAFPTILMKDGHGNVIPVPVNDAIEQGIIVMPNKIF